VVNHLADFLGATEYIHAWSKYTAQQLNDIMGDPSMSDAEAASYQVAEIQRILEYQMTDAHIANAIKYLTAHRKLVKITE
jgi:hypothetical protein